VTLSVLLVEDNENAREALAGYLKLEGYDVVECGELRCAEQAIARHNPDLAVLDVMLPDGDGFLFAKQLKSHRDIPILFLTARDRESDRITGLEIGGDDYVVKPFSPREVVLRINAILRRVVTRTDDADTVSTYRCGESSLLIDPAAHRVLADDQPVTLTAAEWSILSHLAERSPHVLSRIQLLEACLGSIAEESERTIDTHVKNLRRKLGNDRWIETVRGFGYRFGGTTS
jgi:DNA-binding response OmpR family regulator